MSEIPDDYLSLPINPGIGAGGIKLGDTAGSVVSRIGQPLFIRPGRELNGELEFHHYNGLVLAIKKTKVTEIVARQGYLGATPEGLSVGATWSELRQIYPHISFHERQMLWYVPEIDGLSVTIARPPRAEEHPMTVYENLDNQWVDEIYEVIDPEHAFVFSIEIHDAHYN